MCACVAYHIEFRVSAYYSYKLLLGISYNPTETSCIDPRLLGEEFSLSLLGERINNIIPGRACLYEQWDVFQDRDVIVIFHPVYMEKVFSGKVIDFCPVPQFLHIHVPNRQAGVIYSIQISDSE